MAPRLASDDLTLPEEEQLMVLVLETAEKKTICDSEKFMVGMARESLERHVSGELPTRWSLLVHQTKIILAIALRVEGSEL